MLILIIIAQVTVTIYPDSILNPINSFTFGSGDETAQNFTIPGIDTMIQRTDPPLLRFGGISCEYLDWEANDYEGIYYIDCFDTLIIADSLSYGMDSLLRLCERLNIEPILSVNTQINDPGKAARLVEYCNGDTTTPMGYIRYLRGHPDPYNVRYFALGNEPDIAGNVWPTPVGLWTFYRHFGIPFQNWSWRDSSFVDSASFAQLARVYIDSMKLHSPIPIDFIGLSLAGNLSWLGPTLDLCHNDISMVDLHYYPNFDTISDTTRYRNWLASIDTGSIFKPPLDYWLGLVRDSIAAHSGGNQIKLAVFEYNAGIIMIPDWLWWNYLDGLFIADAMGHFLKEGVNYCGSYSIFEGDTSGGFPYFGIIRGDTLSRRMGCWVHQLYRWWFSGSVVKVLSDHFDLRSYAVLRPDQAIPVIAINRDLDSNLTVHFNFNKFSILDTGHVYLIENDTIIGAPYNGTTGIKDGGVFSGDSTGFDFQVTKASIFLFVARPRNPGIVEGGGRGSPRILATPRRRIPQGMRIYDALGRRIEGAVTKPGVYFTGKGKVVVIK